MLRAQNVGLSNATAPLVMVVMSIVYAVDVVSGGRGAPIAVRARVFCRCGLITLVAADLVLAHAHGSADGAGRCRALGAAHGADAGAPVRARRGVGAGGPARHRVRRLQSRVRRRAARRAAGLPAGCGTRSVRASRSTRARRSRSSRGSASCATDASACARCPRRRFGSACERRLVHRGDLLAQFQDAVLPVARRVEPRKRRGERRVVPAPRDPRGVVDEAQRAQCFDQMQFAAGRNRGSPRSPRARRTTGASSPRGRRTAASTGPARPGPCARRRSRRSAGPSAVHSTLPAWQSPCRRSVADVARAVEAVAHAGQRHLATRCDTRRAGRAARSRARAGTRAARRRRSRCRARAACANGAMAPTAWRRPMKRPIHSSVAGSSSSGVRPPHFG